jgi:hypothetical protein
MTQPAPRGSSPSPSTPSAADAVGAHPHSAAAGTAATQAGAESADKKTLHEALTAFEALGTPLWVEKARAAIARSNVGPKVTPA